MPATTGIVLIGGAVAGSAAGAALHRWPAGGTLREPRRSVCDTCSIELRVRDLVPVVSWVALRGRCHACGARIDPRVPLLEGLCAAIAVAVVHVHGLTVAAAILTVGCIAVVVGALVDLEHLVVPDRLTLPLAGLAILSIPLIAGPDRAAHTALWAVGLPLVLRILAAAADRVGRARPVGGGDIKLLVGVLALAGVSPHGPAAVLLGSVVLGGTVAVVGLATGRVTRRSRLPFAPAIAVPFLIVVVAPERAAHLVTIFGGPSWFT